MKKILLILLVISIKLVQAQKIDYSVKTEIYTRNEFDITSVIPFEGGLLSIVMDQKNSSNAKYELKLCKINKDHSLQKNISIGFEPETFIRLIGLYCINGKPIVFYTLYTSRTKLLQIKAVTIDPITLQKIAVKDIKKMDLKDDDERLIITQNADAEWISPLQVRYSQDSTKYLLVYPKYCCLPGKDNNRTVYFGVINEDGGLMYEKFESYPGKFAFVDLRDFCLTKSGKILSVYCFSKDKQVLIEATGPYATILRIINTADSKITEFKFDKDLQFVTHCFFLFNDRDTKYVDMIGTYCEAWDDKEMAGGFRISLSYDDGTMTTIIRQEFPYSIRLTDVFPDYFTEQKRSKGSNFSLSSRLTKVYLGSRENGNIDLLFQYRPVPVEFFTNSFDNQACINFSFSDKKATFSVIRKKQLASSNDEVNIMGVFAVPYTDKLLVFYNDLNENLEDVEKSKEFKVSSKQKNDLVVLIIDNNGNMTKQSVTTDLKEKYPEVPHFRLIDKQTIAFRYSNPKKRNKEFNLGVMRIK